MQPDVLVLTPIKNAARHLDGFVRGLKALSWPRAHLSLGMIEGDSTDDTWERLQGLLPELRERCRQIGVWRLPFGFQVTGEYHRWAPAYQFPRRIVLAKTRNHLLFRALRDEAWVLWLDVDIIEYPPDIIERLIAYEKDILFPHPVCEYGGPTFDYNAWRDHGRTLMHHLRGGADLVRLDAVGATMLLVRADLHRSGLIFPPFPYGPDHPRARPHNAMLGGRRGELESEGLGLMALDMGYQCWGLPNLEILHAREV
jgi:glycosyltransferase involved in cell wall biosynthesis